ncbi:asparagine synthetase B [Bacillus sp. MUM 116]|uniref:asparagine synthase-related protein n=1 Tax=Bacillus sp. MUM 116 TaxID=1678002 RepID=UPI0008F55BD6|nr:asparagine synthase-related protein [Bacillus sp. MUM 116]OIK09387.1 asparagine synthetase B [Bacillus sp. MUM 116]
MSAIAGIFHLNDEPINLEHGRRMMKELEKYPADDVQTWHSDKVFLGCHAQWITPESIGEKLPYYDEERKLAITADAIIDNREELFEKLQIKKSKQRTITDSELILLSYDKWGEDSPKYLIGDFAFMIWDERERKFLGARDPSGLRTLYFFHDKFRFVFCTTIEPLLTLPNIKKQLNENWLAEFLAITVPVDTVDAFTTPYCNINQIPPFHSVTFQKGKFSLTKYGNFNVEKKLNFRHDYEYVEAFQEIFQKAVKSRLRTHLNIGSHLSGGLDSGTVVGYAAKELKKENKLLNTYSYIPPKDFIDYTHKGLMPDERPFIKKTVEFVGGITDHYCDYDGISSYTEIDDILDVNEMPYKFVENSFWLSGTFKKASENNVGILLNGDTGNSTISWGQALYYYAILLKRLKWIELIQELNQYSRNIGGARFRSLPRIAEIAFPFFSKFKSDKGINWNPKVIDLAFAQKTEVFNKLQRFGIDQSGWIATPNLYEQRKIMFDKISTFNSSSTLYSKLSLKYSLWKRDPTNDLRVVRFCFAVPEEQFVKNGLDRALVRNSTKNILPDEVRLNQRIRGVQGADWIHRMIPHWDKLMEEAKLLSNDKKMMEFFDGNVIKSAIVKGEKGPFKEKVMDPDYKILVRSIIVYRFLKKFN